MRKYLTIFILLVSSLAIIFCQPVLALSVQEKINTLAMIKQLKNNGETVYAMIPKNIDEPFFQTAGQACADTATR